MPNIQSFFNHQTYKEKYSDPSPKSHFLCSLIFFMTASCDFFVTTIISRCGSYPAVVQLIHLIFVPGLPRCVRSWCYNKLVSCRYRTAFLNREMGPGWACPRLGVLQKVRFHSLVLFQALYLIRFLSPFCLLLELLHVFIEMWWAHFGILWDGSGASRDTALYHYLSHGRQVSIQQARYTWARLLHLFIGNLFRLSL